MDDLGDSLNVPWKFFFPNTIYSKLTGSDAICPIGGVSCGDILNNNYDFLFSPSLDWNGCIWDYNILCTKVGCRGLVFSD
ncbi:hypothetical protein L1987_29834 [Smallanthus sonchifolius]|uniref:Uncharacterized protein n=1 Tax=Smallanthus sonchifolius TaxID=185202 RepID=A0ACB9I2F1_9ASTR|nr:hypothetical protein L1987_29834 [Smallanthus sonchifolius]